jgi:hypothetical protein
MLLFFYKLFIPLIEGTEWPTLEATLELFIKGFICPKEIDEAFIKGFCGRPFGAPSYIVGFFII